jgi:putative peptide zinc metalloprotease protein
MDNLGRRTQLQVQQARYEEAALTASAEQVRDQSAYRLAQEEALQQVALRDDLVRQVADLTVSGAIPGRAYFPQPERLEGRFVTEGELVGYVLPAGATTIRVALPQADAEFIDTRLESVSAMPVDRPDRPYRAALLRRVPAATNALPSPALGTAGGGPFAADPADAQGLTALDRLVQLDIAVPDLAVERFGGRVLVKFGLGWEPVGFRLLRGVRLSFLSLFAGP